jgi:hypothetical protein
MCSVVSGAPMVPYLSKQFRLILVDRRHMGNRASLMLQGRDEPLGKDISRFATAQISKCPRCRIPGQALG